MKWVNRSRQSCFKHTRLTITVRVIWIERYLKLYVSFNYKPKYHFNSTHSGWTFFRNSHSEVFLGKDVLKICSKFTREHTCQSAIWNSNWTLAWVFSSKFAACLQNTFSQEHLWRTASAFWNCSRMRGAKKLSA